MFGKLLLLPPPPAGKTGFPWTAEVPPQAYQRADYPKISIVTPSYNQAAFLEQTLRSVLLQNYPNLEYIVIDGGSTDGSVEILQKYAAFITYWVSEPDKGQSEAINKGIAKCTGEVFNWLNSDDAYFPMSLLQVAETFMDTQALVVCGTSQSIDTENNPIQDNPPTQLVKGDLISTLATASIEQPSTFFRLDCFQKLGNLSEKLDYRMDWEFWWRFLLGYGIEKVVQIPQKLVLFRWHSDSKSQTQSEAGAESLFQVEKMQILQAFAQKIGDKALLERMKILEIQPKQNYEFLLPNPLIINAKELPKILNTFWFYELKRAYYLEWYKKADYYRQFIDKSQLPTALQKDLSYLMLRVFFKKWFSKQ
jgi:glycosyltransferase involved in cell wall biosynthesis